MPVYTQPNNPQKKHTATRYCCIRGHGFTMMEMIIVVIILGILATAIVPRMTGTDARRAHISRDATEDLLTVLAYRADVSLYPVGLEYNAEENVLRVVTLVVDPQSQQATWQPDQLNAEVRYPEDVRIDRCVVNDEVQRQGYWLVECPTQEMRPAISLHLSGPQLNVTCELQPHETAARMHLADNDDSTEPKPVDLDAEGRGLEPW